MKQLKLFVAAFLVLTSLTSRSQSDTISNRIDTLICDDFNDMYYFFNPNDQSLYNSSWTDLTTNTSLGSIDSILINDIDSVLLLSTPIDTSLSLLMDTIIFRLRFNPVINFDVPPIECFTGDSIIVSENSIIDLQYTDVVYSDSSGNTLIPMNSLLSTFVGNGERGTLFVNYRIDECLVFIDTSIQLETKFQPSIDFDFNRVCFGDSTLIVNQSIFNRDSAGFSLVIEGLESFNESQETFLTLLPNNPDSRQVIVDIDESGCSDRDTFSINNLISPTAEFNIDPVCENDFLAIDNLSSNTSLNSEFLVTVDGIESLFALDSEFILMDTLPDGNYPLNIIVDNQNGCTDTLETNVVIDSVTYVSFDNLESSYCTGDRSEILIASTVGGDFEGPFVEEIGNGEVIFNPTSTGTNIPVSYTFINDLSCTDTSIQFVDTIFASPMIELSGLDPAYCAMDDVSVLGINQLIADNSTFEVLRDGIFIDMQTTLMYEFDPVLPGVYDFRNIYESVDGCRDTLISTTLVNPLPMVTLDSVAVIEPTEVITIGNTSMPDSDVDYLWSNGADSATIDVSLPGIYFVNAINISTGCIGRDTISIKYDIEIETDLVNIQLSPNPTMDIVTLTTSELVQDIRLVNVFGEVVTINGQSSFSTNQLGELTLDMSNQNAGYYYILIPDIGSILLLKI